MMVTWVSRARKRFPLSKLGVGHDIALHAVPAAVHVDRTCTYLYQRPYVYKVFAYTQFLVSILNRLNNYNLLCVLVECMNE